MASRTHLAKRISIAGSNTERVMSLLADHFGIEVPGFPAGTPLRDPVLKAAVNHERVVKFLSDLAEKEGITVQSDEPAAGVEPDDNEVETDGGAGNGKDVQSGDNPQLTLEQLQAMPYPEVREIGKKLEIKGYANLKRDELEAEIVKHSADKTE